MEATKQINKVDCPFCKKRFYEVQAGPHCCDLCGSSFTIDDRLQPTNFKKNHRYVIFSEVLKYITISAGLGWYILAAFYKEQHKLLERSLLNFFCIFTIICLFISCFQALKHGLIGTRSFAEPMVYYEEKPNLFLAWIVSHVVIGIIVLVLFLSQFNWILGYLINLKYNHPLVWDAQKTARPTAARWVKKYE